MHRRRRSNFFKTSGALFQQSGQHGCDRVGYRLRGLRRRAQLRGRAQAGARWGPPNRRRKERSPKSQIFGDAPPSLPFPRTSGRRGLRCAATISFCWRAAAGAPRTGFPRRPVPAFAHFGQRTCMGAVLDLVCVCVYVILRLRDESMPASDSIRTRERNREAESNSRLPRDLVT